DAIVEIDGRSAAGAVAVAGILPSRRSLRRVVRLFIAGKGCVDVAAADRGQARAPYLRLVFREVPFAFFLLDAVEQDAPSVLSGEVKPSVRGGERAIEEQLLVLLHRF